MFVRRVLIAVAALMLLATACGSGAIVTSTSSSSTAEPSDTSDQFEALTAARDLWDDAQLDGYRYRVTFQCECPPETSGPFAITVREGQLLSTVGPVPGAGPLLEEVMIDDLFEAIAAGLDSGVEVEVTYDEAYGFPTMAIIDVEAVAVDGGLAFSISEFEEIDHLGFLLGRVLAGPQCPVQQDPPQPECADQPVAGIEIVISGGEFGDLPAPFVTDEDGGLFVALEPGNYLVTGPDLDEYLGTPDPLSVVIEPGQQEEILLFYDTGIR
jgi:hypothetical protein